MRGRVGVKLLSSHHLFYYMHFIDLRGHNKVSKIIINIFCLRILICKKHEAHNCKILRISVEILLKINLFVQQLIHCSSEPFLLLFRNEITQFCTLSNIGELAKFCKLLFNTCSYPYTLHNRKSGIDVISKLLEKLQTYNKNAINFVINSKRSCSNSCRKWLNQPQLIAL